MKAPKQYIESNKYTEQYSDWVGKKVNKLTILSISGYIRRADIDTSFIPAVHVKCECGTEFVTSFYRVRNGRTPSCGCINKLYHEDPTKGSCMDLMNRYQHSAGKRNYSFELSYEEFREITSKSCHYCGVEPKQSRHPHNCQAPYLHNGIDRKDSKIGYVLDNCLPCCAICNRAKSDMSYEDFLKYLFRIQTLASPKKSGKNGES